MEFDDEEVVEGELVLVEPVPAGSPSGTDLVPARWYERPAIQTAAAAATGVVAGGAALMLARRLGGRAAGRAAARVARDPGAFEPVRRSQDHLPVRSGTYLVHIRVVTRP